MRSIPSQPKIDRKKVEAQIRPEFEKTYGVDQKTRTSVQWSNLVRDYGVGLVCAKERMSLSEVEKRCKEKFSDKIKRQFKEKVRL